MSNKTITVILGALALVCITVAIVGGFKSCKTEPEQPVVVTPDQLNTMYNPVIDSLAKRNYKLEHENDSLKKSNAALSVKREAARDRKNAAAINTQKAEERKDTAALVASLKEQVENADEFMRETDLQLSVQSEIIQNDQRIIENLKQEVQLHTQKNTTLANSFQTQGTMLAQANAKAEKWEGKAKNRGRGVLILAGAVIVEALTIISIL